MNSCSSLKWNSVWIFIFGLILSFAWPAHAQSDAGDMAKQAHYQLKQAADASGPDQVDHLKSAMDILKNLPPGHYYRRRFDAMSYIKSALFELKQGDPNHKVDGYIHDADSAVRDIEG